MKIKTLGIVSLLAIASLALTGCGEEKVSCSLSEEWTTVDINMKFKGDEMNYLWLKASLEVPEISDEDKASLSEIMKQSMEENEWFGSLKNYKDEWNGNTLIITADWDLDDSANELKWLKKEEIIQAREEEWFKCN